LPSFSLANRQTAVCFPNHIRTRLGVGYGISGPTTAGANADLFWRQAPIAVSSDVARITRENEKREPSGLLEHFIDHNAANMVKEQPTQAASFIATNNDAIACLMMEDLKESHSLLSEAVAAL
jgi:hypothetical protein